MATELKRKLDYDDYLRLPDDGKRYEILDGELYVAPTPSALHQRVSKRLQRKLEDYFEARRLGEVFDAAHSGRPWVVIVEPDPAERLLVVVTVYQVSR